MKPQQITSIEQLKKEAMEPADFFIMLNFGARSSKSIYWNGEIFDICNEIDGSWEELTEEQIADEKFTNIGIAIKKGAFYKF